MSLVTPHPRSDEHHRTVHIVVARKANRCTLCGSNVTIDSRIVWYGATVAHVACDLHARRTRA